MALRPGLARVLRMAVFVALVALAVGAVVLSRVEDRLADPLFDVGRQMAMYAMPADRSGGREVWLNGERAFVGTGRSEVDLTRVLDHFEARCRAERLDLESELASVTRGAELAERPGVSAILDGVLRAEKDGAGFVACIDAPEEAGVRDRLRAFDRSGDLADVGELRYVYARRTSSGTALTGVWTRGAFRIGRMFPEAGDAPGRDVPEVPRPPGSRRVLSTWDGELPYRMTVYGSPGERLSDVASAVEAGLRGAGWEVSRTPMPEATGELAISARREDGRSVLVVVTPDADLDVATVVLEPG